MCRSEIEGRRKHDGVVTQLIPGNLLHFVTNWIAVVVVDASLVPRGLGSEKVATERLPCKSAEARALA